LYCGEGVSRERERKRERERERGREREGEGERGMSAHQLKGNTLWSGCANGDIQEDARALCTALLAV